MTNWGKFYLLFLGIVMFSGFGLFLFQARNINAQTPLTYPEIITALSTKLPNRAFSSKDELINWLIGQIKQRRVGKPLTADREEDLRQAGATDQLIEVIRANSPPLPKPSPQPTPDRPVNTPTPTPTPLPTPAPVLPTPTPTPLQTASVTDAVKPGMIRKNSIGMELVYVPPGEFMMGSAKGDKDEKPVHKVTISQGFWMGKYEVTQGQWEKVMGTTLRQQQEKAVKAKASGSHSTSIDGEGADFPMYNVNWNEAKEFVQRMNQKVDGFEYALPTEAQWEYATRAGTTGDYAGELKEMGWYATSFFQIGRGTSHPVGQKKPNAFGLYDVHGNIAEWCEDRYGPYSAASVTDPTGAATGETRIVRGGSWNYIAGYSKSAHRSKYAPSFSDRNVGFRVAARLR